MKRPSHEEQVTGIGQRKTTLLILQNFKNTSTKSFQSFLKDKYWFSSLLQDVDSTTTNDARSRSPTTAPGFGRDGCPTYPCRAPSCLSLVHLPQNSPRFPRRRWVDHQTESTESHGVFCCLHLNTVKQRHLNVRYKNTWVWIIDSHFSLCWFPLLSAFPPLRPDVCRSRELETLNCPKV